MRVLEEAFNRNGSPEIVNTDQASQFTAHEFVRVVKAKGCRLSMDGRGAWPGGTMGSRSGCGSR